ncbi:MAG: DNRLRE domain-containing protein, partial [Desulfobacterales bacterium]
HYNLQRFLRNDTVGELLRQIKLMWRRMIKKIALAAFYMSCIVFWATMQSCTEKTPTMVFDEFTDSTTVGAAKFLVIPKPEFTDTDAVTINTGISPFLYLGQADGKRVSFVIKFSGLPDSLAITKAKLVLKASAFFGTPGGMLTASVHEIKKSWQESDLTAGSMDSDFFDPVSLGNLTFAASDSDTVTISFDAELVRKWVALPDSENFGILVRPDGAFALQQFNSSEALNEQPRLQIFHSDTLRANPSEVVTSEDVFVFEVLNPPADGPLYVGNGFEHKTIIRFDLSEIPKEATINRARLILKIDLANSFLSPTDGFSFGAESLLKDLTDFTLPIRSLIEDTIIAPLSTTLGVVDTSMTLRININNQLQRWSSESQDNRGIILLTRTQGRDLYRLALLTAETDPLNAPRLEIHYTIPPITKRNKNESPDQ